jgi:predicted dehydrogenase
MNLPAGFSYHPMQRSLVSASDPAWIRIGPQPQGDRYEICDRRADSIRRYLRGDWAGMLAAQGNEEGVIYSSAEHAGPITRPNVTIVPNLEEPGTGRQIFGSTFGHWHAEQRRRVPVQAVYEFLSHGLMVLDHESGEPEIWVARPGDKVTVPGECHMTLYNLGGASEPLVTLDFANPDRNRVNQDLVERLGPILFGFYHDSEATFLLNRYYINGPPHAGVRWLPAATDNLRRVVIPLRARLDLGAQLYAEMTANPDVIFEFARLGLRIRTASSEAVLPPRDGDPDRRRLAFSAPLAVATAVPDDAGPDRAAYTEVHCYFFPDLPDDPGRPGSPRGRGIAAMAAERGANKQARLELAPLDRPLVAVVEGSGDWVTEAYRPQFERVWQEQLGRGVSVFYANDGVWTRQPEWLGEGKRHHWETYLDKSDPRDFAIYRALRPDVVFVVTPDFTHASIARHWLGKAPLIFVEKPFDSRLANVDALLRAISERGGTHVLGLDHWLAYALPLHCLKNSIVDHLGGALAAVTFFMTEDRPIELGRDRSLQFGLMLDMTPHLLALLTHFGDLATIDDIRVGFAGQYSPLISRARGGTEDQPIRSFRNETACALQFTFKDDSANGFRVPCRAVVGKGFSRSVRYLELLGRSGKSVRLDLNKRPATAASNAYPWFSLFLMDEPGATGCFQVTDPYDPARALTIRDCPESEKPSYGVDGGRYWQLVSELIRGRATRRPDESSAVASALLLTEARAVVAALDRFWHAVQRARPWGTYGLESKDPVALSVARW